MQRFFGWGMLATSGLGFIGLASPTNHVQNPVGAAIILGIMAVSGALLAWRGHRSARAKAAAALAAATAAGTAAAQRAGEPVEHAILRLAQQKGGRVTPAEVAAEANVPFADAERELDRIEKMGACRLVIGDAGILVYCFAEFEDPSAKQDVFYDEARTPSAQADAARTRAAAQRQKIST